MKKLTPETQTTDGLFNQTDAEKVPNTVPKADALKPAEKTDKPTDK